jgi:sulfur carrier protein ThiS
MTTTVQFNGQPVAVETESTVVDGYRKYTIAETTTADPQWIAGETIYIIEGSVIAAARGEWGTIEEPTQ